MSERTFLEEITIRSIGVIDQAGLEISKGLTVLTGETGAGKTMILTALNLILGGKSDSALVRKGSERLLASGRFSIPLEQVSSFENLGVAVDDSWEDAFREGEIDIKWVPVDAKGNPVPKGEHKYYHMDRGPKDTYKCDYDGMKKVEERIQNGFRLFGKYFSALWD